MIYVDGNKWFSICESWYRFLEIILQEKAITVSKIRKVDYSSNLSYIFENQKLISHVLNLVIFRCCSLEKDTFSRVKVTLVVKNIEEEFSSVRIQQSFRLKRDTFFFP